MKRILSFILAIIMVTSAAIFVSAESNAPFTDVKVTAWYAEAVSTVYENGIMEGKDGNRLDPRGTATRAEIATVLFRYVTLKTQK